MEKSNKIFEMQINTGSYFFLNSTQCYLLLETPLQLVLLQVNLKPCHRNEGKPAYSLKIKPDNPPLEKFPVWQSQHGMGTDSERQAL